MAWPGGPRRTAVGGRPIEARDSTSFLGASGQNLGTRSIAAATSEGAYTYVSRELLAGDIPAAAALLSVEFMLDQVSSGTAFFDDLMVEAIP